MATTVNLVEAAADQLVAFIADGWCVHGAAMFSDYHFLDERVGAAAANERDRPRPTGERSEDAPAT